MKKKITLLFIALTLAATVTACGKKNNEAVTEDTEIVENGFSIGDSSEEGEEYVEEGLTDYTLEEIAELNGINVEDLNVLGNEDGGLIFLGHKYGDEIVTNEDEALASLDHVKTLAKLDGVNLQYNRTDVSPVTGNIVYTFYQTSNAQVDGEEVAAKFFNSLIKVITDKDGNLVGVSADIIPEFDVESFDEEELISKDEAIDFVKNLINDKKRRIYEDVSEYAFWDDQGTVLQVSDSSKITPAWFIYADAESTNKASKPYEVFVVSFSPTYDVDEDGNEILVPAVVSSFYVETLDPNDMMDIYTSVFYFDGMKNAGEYTYDIDMSWVKKYYPTYNGPKKASYTVPVMYSEEEDLYYLGDAEKKITLSNYYDFFEMDTTNAYVTDNPDDIGSWHFQLDEASDGSTGKYFNNPNYVISSFAVMCDTWNMFSDRYGLDSVDGTGLPTMLTVYQIEEHEYPEKEEDFNYNATNMGQNRDWQVMCTSIVFPGCLEHEVMAHEYTHGINGQLTMSQYLNGSGAVMESYADIIGDQICMLNNYPECVDGQEWHMGGILGEYMRNMGNPKEFNMPQYLGGNYFLSPIAQVIGADYDMGGVHTNSSVLNYLAYCMVNGTGNEEEEPTFTMDECLDVWFDTLYYTNYQSDYYDVACYLQLAANSLGIEDAKREYLVALLNDFGFKLDINDGETHPNFEEDYDLYHVSLTYDDEVYNNLSDVFKFGFTFFDKDENFYDAGGLAENGELYYAVDEGKEIDFVRFAIGDQLNYETFFYSLDNVDPLPHEIEIFFTVAEVEPGITYTTDPGYEYLYVTTYDDVDYEVYENEDGSQSLDINSEGTIVVSIKNDDESSEDYGRYSVLMIIAEEK